MSADTGDEQKGSILENELRQAVEYRQQVLDELGKRESKLADIDKKIAEVEHEMASSNSSREAVISEATAIIVADAFNRALRRKLKMLKGTRAEVVESINMARERLEDVDAEIAELESRLENIENSTGEN
ncbi:MAG: hypothetical protein D6719_06110 [Candidatus Dadabacteria bacterium]|nr:MAG: hypothetical protein D6719_06110 [Candidatus Dadabacteria bacterium]